MDYLLKEVLKLLKSLFERREKTLAQEVRQKNGISERRRKKCKLWPVAHMWPVFQPITIFKRLLKVCNSFINVLIG